MLKTRILTITGIALLTLGVLAAVVSAQTPAPSAAVLNQTASSGFGELITSAQASGKAITFDFIVPLVTGERVWTLPDETAKRNISSVGSDYVCFSEPWNEGSRERCTLFSNITSVTFLK